MSDVFLFFVEYTKRICRIKATEKIQIIDFLFYLLTIFAVLKEKKSWQEGILFIN